MQGRGSEGVHWMRGSVDVVVYRSTRRELTYLYVPAATLPEALPVAVTGLGPWERALAFALSPEKRLAQADAKTVLAALARDGFYVQFPPRAH
jgi:uncharacterized protein YcgL (UPF0745 family)